MNAHYDTFSTPMGDFSAAVDEEGAVVATAFGGQTRLRERMKPCTLKKDTQAVAVVRAQVEEYFAGKRRDFRLELAPEGTEFQQSVWQALLRIPYGDTVSYGQLAKGLGKPGASRAVGSANGANPICLIIPCHRVIGADGSLSGFAFGPEIKRRLLELEGGEGLFPSGSR
jgi:methylated-DNA-[protein]-cysteine S-methyltransferase